MHVLAYAAVSKSDKIDAKRVEIKRILDFGHDFAHTGPFDL